MSKTAAGGGLSGSREIVELDEKYDSKVKISSIHSEKPLMKPSIEDDINKLFEAIDIRNSSRGIHFRDKSAMKRPMRVGPSAIGISEPVSLKQALRGLCISQASEMAATKKQMLRPLASPCIPETGAITKLSGSVVIKAGEVGNGRSHNEGNHDLVKIFFLPERNPNSVVMRGGKGPKGEVSQRLKSSAEECSSNTTSHSGESSLGVCIGPHTSKEGWEAIRKVEEEKGSLRWGDFKLLRKLGDGDVARVFLCELIGTGHLFIAKVVDNESKNMARMQTEKEILEMLDPPFFPTLYAHFVMNEFSCLVMEYCPGGDLYALRLKKQPDRCFMEKEARFYAAEVVLALEYLHMLGVVHRDLRPDNILIREDGHIMLSDFNSSLKCTVKPPGLPQNSPPEPPPRKLSNPCSASLCINPSCLPLSRQLSCLPVAAKTRRRKSEQVIVGPPSAARSNFTVGMHDEYLAPEIIKGEDHGSSADWWGFGILLYELLYGGTPFKESNAVSRRIEFPQWPVVSPRAKDLMSRLLVKDPGNRMGSAMGAAEIKQHPFFDGLNWALIGQEMPPELPSSSGQVTENLK